MFGYIKPDNAELLVRESEQYKSVYCSLCKALGKHYGFTARVTLSYDCTFLALILLGMQTDCTRFHKGRCVVNPMIKCTYCTGHTEALQLPAAVSVLSMYQKIQDDLQDGGFLKKLRSWCLLPLSIRPYRKASRDYPALQKVFAEMTANQQRVEAGTGCSLDSCAEPTAQMLKQVFRTAAGDDPQMQKVFEIAGYFTGKWIYVMDAADDLEDDLKKGAFNPLIRIQKLQKTSSPEEIRAAKTYCNGALNQYLSQVIAAVRLIPFQRFGPIVENIVEKGLPLMQRMRLFEKEKNT